MPAPRMPDDPTPFCRVLLDYMWSRPRGEAPLTTGQVAQRLGTSRQTVAGWIYDHVTPSLDRMFTVLDRLRIPISALEEAYAAQGLPSPIPPGLRMMSGADTEPDDRPGLGPEPRQVTTTTVTRAYAGADPWLEMMGSVSSAMREEGMDEMTIRAVLAHIQQKRAGQTPNQRNVIAEHSPTQQANASEHPSQTTHKATHPPENNSRRGPARSSDSGRSRPRTKPLDSEQVIDG